jgi:hypothetical protein
MALNAFARDVPHGDAGVVDPFERVVEQCE